MRHLRSSLFPAIVAVFVFTGFGVGLFGDCCGHHEEAQAGHCDSAPDDQAPGNGDGCQCICHQILTPLTPESVRVAGTVFITADFVAHADEFPPDAVPLGIEYPPQLA